jgi:isopentenyl diphosphate isomerase/L-lactate dehydrogenase-like FMN-dependent dehydrogenase
MSFAELERRAELALPPGTWSYVAGGAGDEHTQRNNRAAFEHWGLLPRMLRASADRDLSVELFGTTFHTPVFLAPLGVIGICTQDGHGDLAAARAAAATGVPMVASTLSQDPLEDVAAEFGETPGFFQRASVTQTTPAGPSTRVSTASTSPTTAAARPTAASPRSTAWPTWPRRCQTCHSYSTPVSAPAPMW